MPGFRGGRGRQSGGRGRGGARRPATQARDTFQTSRLGQTEYARQPFDSDSVIAATDASRDDASQEQTSPESLNGELNEQGPLSDQDETSQSESEDDGPSAKSYATLLQLLSAGRQTSGPARKKRKIGDAAKGELSISNGHEGNASSIPAAEEVPTTEALDEEVEADEEAEDGIAHAESDDEDSLLKDPFENHYSAVVEQDLKDAAEQVERRDWQTQTVVIDDDIRKTITVLKGRPTPANKFRSVKDLCLKRRLLETGTALASSLSSDEKDLASAMFNYTDVIDGNRTLRNSSQLRDLSALHALNHVFKTRDRILKNNAKLSSSSETLDLRDQGFTRPKVLIIVPTKQACVRFVDSIVKLCEPDQQENKSRFLETFSHEDIEEWPDKPEDFRALFGGNHEEDFRIGLKFTRKTIKYFSGFYNSDVIIGSPLGLMRTITTGGGGGRTKDGVKNKKTAHDADFLSSIEVVVMDHANALQMQNWQHVEYVFSQLNLLPKDSHGCDFSRVRHWYLDGRARYLRQTIILSDFLTPEINSLASSRLSNVAGRVKYLPTYPGAMLGVNSILPVSVPQTFLRVDSPSPLADADSRFKFFTTTVLPPLVRHAKTHKGTLLYATSYADFVRLRNHLSTAPDATNLSFGTVSEYTPVKDVLRARSHFLSGRHALLLYSERAHHHFRYRLKGVRRVIFYNVPENPLFWTEVVGLLGLAMDADFESGRGKTSTTTTTTTKGAVRALFSKWDAMKLERIVGTERVGRLIHDRGGDTFDFV
ncbi:hypothetical protein PV08_03828 [Exophiala spinifera]|uniref:U3 small nucleolar RNA-associated protein 25 n=1 Tax=Exophiala spinifera TaxID=91928 RepID=A0A0D2BDE9_9EURO|nr:uncharacterized protein PV08_03828 [Exophiala spinifera]KIW16640.1 hypothetical protein PV08_03828 [Exophiala spinifera]